MSIVLIKPIYELLKLDENSRGSAVAALFRLSLPP